MEPDDPAPSKPTTPRQDETQTKRDLKPTVLLFSFQMLCDGLRALVERMDQLAVVGQCSEIPKALEILTRVKPDLAIVDLDYCGLGLLQTFVADNQSTRFIVLIQSDNKERLRDVARLGVKGCVLGTGAARQLLDAINRVLQGGTYFPDDLPDSPPPGPHSRQPNPHSPPVNTMKAGLALEIPEVGYCNVRGSISERIDVSKIPHATEAGEGAD